MYDVEKIEMIGEHMGVGESLVPQITKGKEMSVGQFWGIYLVTLPAMVANHCLWPLFPSLITNTLSLSPHVYPLLSHKNITNIFNLAKEYRCLVKILSCVLDIEKELLFKIAIYLEAY